MLSSVGTERSTYAVYVRSLTEALPVPAPLPLAAEPVCVAPHVHPVTSTCPECVLSSDSPFTESIVMNI